MHLASLQFYIQLEVLINSHTVSLPFQDEGNSKTSSGEGVEKTGWDVLRKEKHCPGCCLKNYGISQDFLKIKSLHAAPCLPQLLGQKGNSLALLASSRICGTSVAEYGLAR